MKWGFRMNIITIAFILFLIFAVSFLIACYIGPVIGKLHDLLEKFWRKILKDDDILSDKVGNAVFLSLLFIVFMISGVIAEILIKIKCN